MVKQIQVSEVLTEPPLPRSIKTMLFADVAGFSELKIANCSILDKFLGGISKLLKKFSFDPALLIHGEIVSLLFLMNWMME